MSGSIFAGAQTIFRLDISLLLFVTLRCKWCVGTLPQFGSLLYTNYDALLFFLTPWVLDVGICKTLLHGYVHPVTHTLGFRPLYVGMLLGCA
jgi:hypothetical protein